ncbi:MAG: PQQ-binding-like beta-propeller repeat protein [bacterium]|nr:PQQ-binding-like beta-propeller repeat protein [bacterium]
MIKPTALSLVLASALCACCVPADRAATDRDWPGWRGPHQDGSSRPDGFTSGSVPQLSAEWERGLGSGYSGVAVVGEIAVTTFSDGETDHAVALAADDGSELWRYSIGPAHRQEHPEADDGPLSMPLVHEGTVYGVGPAGDLFALRLADGRERWRLRMTESFDAPPPPYGFATSPAVADGTLIVQTGAREGRTTLGLDPASGETLWSHGDDSVAYQSPLIRAAGSRPQVAVVTDLHVFGLDPATGEELWSNPHVAPVRDGYAQVLFHDDDRMIGYYLTHAMGYRLVEADGRTGVEETWRSLELKSNLAVPVVSGGRVYGFQGGRLTGLDALTGEKLWREDEDSTHAEGRGILLLGDLLVVWDADGILRVLDPSGATAHEVARFATGLGNGYAPPSFAGGRIFVRNATGIAAIRISPGELDSKGVTP